MLKQAALIALMGLSASAMAGQWQVKVGGSAIAPTQDTKILGGAATVEADSELAFTPSVEYFFNDNFSAEVLLAAPISHDVSVRSAGEEIAGVKLKHLPPTVTAKYHLKNSTGFTPYVGVGATAFIPWDEEASGVLADTKVKVKEDYGYAAQIGFNFQPADAKNWGVFADVRYADLNPKVETAVEKFKLDIDPVIYTIGYSYKF
ncbi:OmpW family protein [Acinetobacter chinensis]|jgi:outer membrane protein|uniref:OmpW family outer membrane protein n=1 Tax=Acinetobacter chinensis TaxID=2004650 RepID=A0A3B7LUU9_9GAMM|nr:MULTISPECIES: OmpW family outer membrane protein [Acinetobacter]AXY55527.1 OmpW family protein [Acinetobacter chinensis]AXY61373.1 OmpW family protein [Acinetobacter sp. WCHAc010052]MDV2469551.1 OmpW family outer membrane protein [Acinetobacter chinensis]WOE41852.1 OmpW family outer membrane protein [Acinetobacter chinensis]